MLSSMISGHVDAGASGCIVYDEEGADYLDCGGHGVYLLGHRHPAIVAAVKAQIDEQPMPSRFLLSPVVARAAEALAGVTPEGLTHVFFHTTGAEAVEMSIKLARLAGRRRLVAMEGGYHGKTMGALSLATRSAITDPFAPLLADVDHVPFGDAAALDAVLAEHPGECCVIVEPVQGEAGVRIPPAGYLSAVHAACRRHGAVLVLDEIQTGLGRLGRWWGADLEGVTPDVLLAGKILGGGILPVSAVVATDAMFAPLDRDPFLHSSTFGNAPVLAAAALATVEVLSQTDVIARAQALGARLLAGLEQVVAEHGRGLVKELRGAGLLIGIELADPAVAGELTFELVGRRVLPSYALNDAATIRLTPSALMDDEQVERLLDTVGAALSAVSETIPGG
jgi:putrescine aminotransferase